MSMLAPLGVALLTAIAAAFAAGLAADFALSWLNVSAADGNHSLFTAFMGLLGFGGGFLIGLVVALLVPAGYSFQASLGASVFAAVGLVAVVTGVSRLLSDTPMRVGVAAAVLLVEVRWPHGHERPRAQRREYPRVDHVALEDGTARDRRLGILWPVRAEQQDGRWVVPGAVPLDAHDGDRSLEVVLNDDVIAAFDISIPPRPDPDALEWSDWLPEAAGDGFAYRYRVVRSTDPLRTVEHGSFTISARAADYFPDLEGRRRQHNGTVQVTHGGEPLRRVSARRPDGSLVPQDLAGLRDAKPIPHTDALFVLEENGVAWLVRSEAGTASAVRITHLHPGKHFYEITSNPSRYTPDGVEYATRDVILQPLDGDLYLFSDAVLDTRKPEVHHLPQADWIQNLPFRAPVGAAPDGTRFVRAAYRSYGDEQPVLVVTDLKGAPIVTLDVQGEPGALDHVDPAWLLEHYEWVRHDDGWHLAAREGRTAH